MPIFFSIQIGFAMFELMVHTSYGVDTLYSLFSAIWRRFKHDIHNKYDTLFIYYNNYSWNTTKLFVIIQIQHIALMFTESDINRTRKSEDSLIESKNI